MAYRKIDRNMDPGSGRLQATPLQMEFIEWLLDPSKNKGTMGQWATDHHVARQTLTMWKSGRDLIFKAAWEKRAAELNVMPDRIQAVVDAVWARAITGDPKAAALYLQYVDKFTPKQKVETSGAASLADMSDEDLLAALEDLAVQRGLKEAEIPVKERFKTTPASRKQAIKSILRGDDDYADAGVGVAALS